MQKRITDILRILVLCVCMTVPAFAAEPEGNAGAPYRVMDMADLLTDGEEAALNEKLSEISVRQNMDVTVATTDDLEGSSPMVYADELYEACNFGYGSGKDGLLLLISIEDNDWYISTYGYGITVFTDAGIQYIGRQIRSDLSDGNFAAAFDAYAALCDDFITQANTDRPYDRGNLPREPLSLIWIPVSAAIGLVLSIIVLVWMISRMKTVRFQAAAGSYLKQNSLKITESRDMFLYRTVTKTERPKSSSGSSTHRSSSGTSHGGGGGKF